MNNMKLKHSCKTKACVRLARHTGSNAAWGGVYSKARLMGAVAEALHAETDDMRDQLRLAFDALLQQRLVEQCPPCTLPRLKTPVRGPCQ